MRSKVHKVLEQCRTPYITLGSSLRFSCWGSKEIGQNPDSKRNKHLKGMAPTECPISARLLAFLQSLTSWAPVHAMGEYSSKCGGVVSKSDLLQGNPDINKSR